MEFRHQSRPARVMFHQKATELITCHLKPTHSTQTWFINYDPHSSSSFFSSILFFSHWQQSIFGLIEIHGIKVLPAQSRFIREHTITLELLTPHTHPSIMRHTRLFVHCGAITLTFSSNHDHISSLICYFKTFQLLKTIRRYQRTIYTILFTIRSKHGVQIIQKVA